MHTNQTTAFLSADKYTLVLIVFHFLENYQVIQQLPKIQKLLRLNFQGVKATNEFHISSFCTELAPKDTLPQNCVNHRFARLVTFVLTPRTPYVFLVCETYKISIFHGCMV